MKNIETIEKLRDKLTANRDKIGILFPNWDRAKDARVTIFAKCINVCNSVQLSFAFLHFHLRKGDWWKQIAGSKILLNDINIYVSEYEMFTKIGFVQFSFSSIESSFRVFVKSLDASACNNGTAEFKSIYSWLLKRLSLQAHENLLDTLRLIRNTIHNNGVYFHKSGVSESVTFRDKIYNFNLGKPVDFVTWDFIFEVMQDVEILIMDVVQSNEIASFHQIIDPFAPQ